MEAYSSVFNTYSSIFMKLELHKLEFHAIFFFFLKFHRPILDFLPIELFD